MEAKEFIWGYISLKNREILGVHQFSETPECQMNRKMYAVSERKHC